MIREIGPNLERAKILGRLGNNVETQARLRGVEVAVIGRLDWRSVFLCRIGLESGDASERIIGPACIWGGHLQERDA